MNRTVIIGVPTILLTLVAAILLMGNGGAKAAPPLTSHSALSSQSSPHAPVGTGFTYQGRLKNGGNPANGQYDFTFKLYDALTGGAQAGTTVTVTNQTVTDGLFTVLLDFGAGAFAGQARWLEISVRPAGGGSYTTLAPRQAITPAPYAANIAPGSVMSGTQTTPMLQVHNLSTGDGIHASSLSGYGVLGISDTGDGLRGSSINSAGVYGTSTNSSGVRGRTYGYQEAGVLGSSDYGYGVHGLSSSDNAAVYGQHVGGTGSRIGVYGSGNTGVRADGAQNGVYAQATDLYGVGVTGVANNGVNAYGVFGDSVAGTGVYGRNGNGSLYGVLGSGGVGVYGLTNHVSGIGTRGDSQNGYGVYGVTTGSGYAGYFTGRVHVTGNLSKGGGSFKIDHPLDPQNKYLYHSFVESPDMMNIYNGNVTLDGKGEVVVTLPAYFDALNKEFRYQLTPIGAPGPNLYVAEEIKSNLFKIAGGAPGMRVSWQVTGIREDAYAEKHRIPVEETKSPSEQGKYLHPTEHGQPESKGIDYERAQYGKRQNQLEPPAQPATPDAPRPGP